MGISQLGIMLVYRRATTSVDMRAASVGALKALTQIITGSSARKGSLEGSPFCLPRPVVVVDSPSLAWNLPASVRSHLLGEVCQPHGRALLPRRRHLGIKVNAPAVHIALVLLAGYLRSPLR